MEALLDATLGRWFPAAFRAGEPALMGRVREMLLATPVNGYAGCCAAIRDMDLRDRIQNIFHETLVIVGDKDPATPPAEGEFIHERVRVSSLIRLDAAHVSNIEKPEEFASAVDAFL
jgi:3-oxoadipate enol-lactonase